MDSVPLPTGETPAALPEPQAGIIFVYALTCPETGQAFYVGKTNTPRTRWLAHCRRQSGNRALVRRLNSLRERGLKPGMAILETVSAASWQEAEKRWIAHHRSEALLNASVGGESGPIGIEFTEEHRRRMGESRRGMKLNLSSEAREAIRQRNLAREPRRGWTHTPEARKKITEANVRSAGRIWDGFIDPEGEAIAPFTNLQQFCRERNLHGGAMHRVYCGTNHSYKGWTRPRAPGEPEGARSVGDSHAKLWEGFVDPSGVTIGSIWNLTAFCRKYGLNKSGMMQIYHGLTASHKGWTHLRAGIERPGGRKSPLGKIWPGFVDPEGREAAPFRSLKSFCKGRGLDMAAMHRVAQGKNRIHKGWTCPHMWEPREPVWGTEHDPNAKTWEGFRRPDGQSVTVVNLRLFCRENSLNPNSMRRLYLGTLKSHNNWTYKRAP